MTAETSESLYGIVDMGSNGIRFSISNLAAPTSRSLPTLFQSRSGISLYDAQYDAAGARGPIPPNIIDEVLEALRRFKIVCADFGVPGKNVVVLATEATRTAVNSDDYRRQIKASTGWEVQMLSKEMEGQTGAMGVASSFHEVEGLVMDLGGGSTQITWIIAKKGEVETSPRGSFSFPYGAAALTRRLAEAEAQGSKATDALRDEIRHNLESAYHELEIPPSLQNRAKEDGGFTLYLSGGGFRGWGYLLMSRSSIAPYPVPIINGFQVSKSEFQNVIEVQQIAAHRETFRVSKRRAAQVPAVAFLINALTLAIPHIKQIRFCQGGVREGHLFSTLPASVRAEDPLLAASRIHARPASPHIARIFHKAIPTATDSHSAPASLYADPVLLATLANLIYLHTSCPKESASLSALYTPLTGELASVHGISHHSRALIALLLCQRWSGDLAPPHDDLQDRLRRLVSPEEAWWCMYLGKVAALVGDVYPAGVLGPGTERVLFRASWKDGLGKHGKKEGIGLQIFVCPRDEMTGETVLRESVDAIEDVGKKKHYVAGYGLGIEVERQLFLAD